MQRFTVSINDDLAEDLEKYIHEKGYANRSEAFRDLFRQELAQRELEKNMEGHCVAVVSYVYNHHERQLALRMTSHQHDHADIVISQMHVHIGHDDCLETIFLRGHTQDVLNFAKALIAEPGIKHGSINAIPIPGDKKHTHCHDH